MKTSEQLEIGSTYSRKQLQSLFGINDATINTGIFQPKGHDSVWLFVTEEKTADRTQYEDRLDGDDLYFEGQTQGRTDDLIERHRDRGLELLLFHRKSKSELPEYAFRYEGPFEYVTSEGAKPTKFRFRREGNGTPLKRLVTVKTAAEVLDNIRRFAETVQFNGDRALNFARSSTYWVYDADEDVFCPGAFAGYRDFNFPLYATFETRIYKQIGYDGSIAKRAIERVLGNYAPNAELTEHLRTWLAREIRPGALAETSHITREFVTTGSRNYRSIACNPSRYDGLSACRNLAEITWTADPGDIDEGDRVIIWQTLDAQGNRGVVGIGECFMAPAIRPETPVGLPYWKETPPGPASRCRIRLLPAPGLPLWLDDHPDLLSDLPVARARGGTHFSLDRDNWHAIRRLAGAEVRPAENDLPSSSHARQVDPLVRKAVEMHAMAIAESHFLRDGWKVDPGVHKTMPYDLLCEKDGERLYVEAKGLQASGQMVVLTRGEVEHVKANAERCVLFVVSGIKVDHVDGKPQASGGTAKIIRPWQIDDDDLSATQYDYSVPGDG